MIQEDFVVVFGATGARGDGLIPTILNDLQSKFSLGPTIRPPILIKPGPFQKMGAEVVAGDVDDVDGMKRLLRCAYVASFRGQHDLL